MPNSICALCGKMVLDKPITEGDLIFDSEKCKETYQKLASIYGHNISDLGLPDVLNANFFFVDIVGLSDPSLSVKRQMLKIEALNQLVGSCEAFIISTKKRIILPTGDGMVIVFLLNPELPLQLSMQLHKKLKEYNKNRSDEDKIGVRIGLNSGSVFIHNDINNNKNVWGPGLVLARRVMDLGDDLHILLVDKFAEELISLNDDYRNIIKPISEYKIKHEQIIKVYSAYSSEFGNHTIPEKIQLYLNKK